MSNNFIDLNPIFDKMDLHTRSQGKRGTCSVFTFVGALEYAFAIKKGKGKFLSVEFLNWASNKIRNGNSDGTFFFELMKAFAEYGICSEDDMPYMPEFNPDLQPSDEILEKAIQAKNFPAQMHWIKEWDINTGLTDDHFREIKLTLDNNCPVCGGFRWPKDAQWKDGVLQMCPPEDVYDGHSVILSGYKDDQIGEGVFFIRNSGGNSRSGFISYEYAKTYMNDAIWISIP